MPFFHIFGANVLLLTGLELGAKLVTLPKLELPTYFKAVNEHKVIYKHITSKLAQGIIITSLADSSSPGTSFGASFDPTETSNQRRGY